jgi:hypothetical protein
VHQTFHTERRPEGLRYILPSRGLSDSIRRKFGTFLIISGAIAIGFMAFWMAAPLQQFQTTQGLMRWFLLAFGLMGLPGLAIGGFLFACGLAVYKDAFHTEIQITEDKLIVRECAGPLRIRFKRKLTAIETIVVHAPLKGSHSRRGAPMHQPDREEHVALTLKGPAKPLVVAPMYPRPLLESLAQSLAQTIGLERPGNAIAVEHEVEEEQPGEEEVDEHPLAFEQPPESDVVFESHDQGGVSFAIPESGLGRGSYFLFPIGFMIGLVGLGMIVSVIRSGHVMTQVSGLAISISIVLLSAWMVRHGLHLGRSRYIIGAAKGRLLIKCTSPVKTRTWEFSAEEIERLTTGPSGTMINDVPVIELQILPINAKKVGLLGTRDGDELAWMVAHLRRALNSL